MKKSLKIVFFGNEHLATGVESQPLLLQALIKSQHQVVALVVHSSDKTSRKAKREPSIELAEAHNIPVFNPAKPAEILDNLQKLGADCGVLAAYGKMVSGDVIGSFPYGIINLHPSLLPQLRGSTPIESVILSGLSETGVSIMKLVKQMDAGPVYRQETVAIPMGVSKQELATILHEIGQDSLLKVLDDLDTSESQLKSQDESAATFCSLLSKTDGLIDWNEPAESIEREVRAYSGWPGSWTVLGGMRLKITCVEIEEIPIDCADSGEWIIYNSALYVACGDKKYLRIDRLQPENKKEMPILAFLSGYGNRLSPKS